MASFNMGSGKAVETANRPKVGKDFLDKEKDLCSPSDYREAGMGWVSEILGLKETEDDANKLVFALRNYLDKYKTDKLSKKGEPLADIGGYNPAMTARAFGAIYGDGDLGGVIYIISSWFDTKTRLERLKALLAGDKPKAAKR